MATGDIAIPSFEAVLNSTHEILGLVTQPDKPVGRKQVLTAPAIKTIAQQHNLDIWQPEKASDPSFIDGIKALAPDVIIVIAYGQILTQDLINVPNTAIVNLHASLLPKYRGAACIQAAIDSGDLESGMTLMHVVKALDAGDIILQKKCEISPQTTAGELHDELARLGPDCLLEGLEQFEQGTGTRTPQDESQVTYISKLLRHHGEIDWSRPAEEIERRIRAYHPWPGTFTTFIDNKGKQKRLKVFPQTAIVSGESGLEPGSVVAQDDKFCIQTGTDLLEITQLQPEGGRRMTSSDFFKGSHTMKLT